MGKKSSAPKSDPRIGQAALMSAELGQDYLAWMQDQAAISNEWATEDRARYKGVFEPLQDQFITEAQGYDTAGRRQDAASEAVADVENQAALARDGRSRQMARMGVDPRSGRYNSITSRDAMQTGLAKAGAANTARRTVENTGRSLRASAVNMGQGGQVNPATSLGMANSAMSSGFNGAMQGQGQMGSLLNTQYQNEMQSWNANQAQSGALWGAVGNVAGAFMFSSKELKEDKRKIKRSLLDEVRKMPVEDWKYKDGVADGGQHTGPYAEDFQAATGKGDGKTISYQDALGTTLGALQELDRKVTALSRSLPRKAPEKRAPDAQRTPAERTSSTTTRTIMRAAA